MRAVLCSDFSEPLHVAVVADPPPPGAHEVLVEVSTCGVNFVDGLIVTGRYQLKPPLPHIPGFEVAGTVRALGSSVKGLQLGQAVFATTGLDGGGYAELALVDASKVFALPAALSPGQGATFPQSYCTALFALDHRIQLRPGQTMLVLGASGGVGRAAVDVGKALGARVIAAASSDERLAAVASIGPDATINYSTEDLKEQARKLSDGGVDVVYDPLGGNYSEAALRALGDDGVLLVIGFAAGAIPKLPANQILLRNRRVVGVDWGGWRTRNPDMQITLINQLDGLLEAGKLHPREPVVYPLAEVNVALSDVNERRVVGKVVLSTHA